MAEYDVKLLIDKIISYIIKILLALDNTVKSIIMSKTYFEKVVEATGKNFSIKQSISGYYRLMLDDEPYFDDSAADEVNKDYETAEAFFIALLLENEVPENRKKMLGGSWVLA